MGLLKLWLFSIRDAFILLLPLVFFRSILQLVQFFPLPQYKVFMAQWMGGQWETYLSWGINAIFGVWVMSLSGLVALLVHQRLLRERRSEDYLSPLIVVLSSLVNFIFYLYLSGSLQDGFIGFRDMLPALIAGLITPFVFVSLVRLGVSARSQHWYHQDVLFYRAIRFTLLFVLATLFSFAVIIAISHMTLFSINPLDHLIQWAHEQTYSIWMLSFIASLINQVFWYVGIQGTLILNSYFGSLFLPYGAPYDGHSLSYPLFDSFVLFGGSGSTLGLVLAIVLSCKQGAQRKVAYLGIIPSLFNINEIILFGLPVVLNLSYLIPFLVVPILLSFMSIGAVEFGWITLQSVHLPWTTPPLISGYLLTGSWHGVALQAVELAVAMVLYLPFVRRVERRSKLCQRAHFDHAIQEIIENKQPLQRHDDIGLIARNLFLDLQQSVRSGALSLAYQPKHDRAGRIVGVEALLRWKHEYMGNISPVVAVALAEEGGFIEQLGDWVINEACACKARWNKTDAALFSRMTMAINLSPLQLLDRELANRLGKAMHRNCIRTREVEIEITESQSIPERPEVDKVFHALAELGVLLSIDDFGMGFASLRYLKRFHVDVIKIDGSITKDVIVSEINRDIIKSITALGRSRDIKVVAEFVETADQRRLLRRLGCDVFQGYFHSAPLTESELVAYVESASLNRKGGRVDS